MEVRFLSTLMSIIALDISSITIASTYVICLLINTLTDIKKQAIDIIKPTLSALRVPAVFWLSIGVAFYATCAALSTPPGLVLNLTALAQLVLPTLVPRSTVLVALLTLSTTVTSNLWQTRMHRIRLLPEIAPQTLPTLRRPMNKGAAFWAGSSTCGSEVGDTSIVARARSATLQAFYTTQARRCACGAVSYMCSIWMFVFINSFIHALMVEVKH